MSSRTALKVCWGTVNHLPAHTSYHNKCRLEQLFKKSSKIANFQYNGISEGNFGGKSDFSWFFKICSRRHKISSKVCRSILGVQRTYFRPKYTFPAISGQILDLWKYHWKSSKIRFLSKIRFSIYRPELSGHTIYGRKWIPEVF